jgi:hypothetical protein
MKKSRNIVRSLHSTHKVGDILWQVDTLCEAYCPRFGAIYSLDIQSSPPFIFGLIVNLKLYNFCSEANTFIHLGIPVFQ